MSEQNDYNASEAYKYGAQMAAEYAQEIGKSDLAQMTPQEIQTFSECMCKNYHIKFIELNVLQNV